MLDERSKSLVRVLIYPVQFDRDPKDGIERVLEQVVKTSSSGATSRDFLAAVKAALHSPDKLSDLTPQPHDEATIRAFLAEIKDRLSEPPHGLPVPANDTAAKATREIGDIESTGEHKGEIYGGIYPADNKPIWFSTAPDLVNHDKAAAWAEGQGGSLPPRKQGDYLTTLEGKGGAFTEIFNRGNSFPAGFVWLAEPDPSNRNYAWCQRLSTGDQFSDGGYHRDNELPVLCVRR
jgi:hypothetical protein